MSLVLFFGLAALIFIVSTIYVGVVLRHYYLQSKVARNFEERKTP